MSSIAIQPSEVVLFQGDSITDCGRDRASAAQPNHGPALGYGYAFFAGAMLLDRFSRGHMKVYNRGISGNRVTNLQQRWQEDCIDLKPTVLSILIGINDTWHGVAKGTPENGVPLEKYDMVYRQILDDAKNALPGLKLVICEPFVTECGAVTELNFHPDVEGRQAIARQIALDYGAVFVPFQSAFDQAVVESSAADLAGDGVHPTVKGHMLMARTWLDAVSG